MGGKIGEREVLYPEMPLQELEVRKNAAMAWMEKAGLDGLLLFNPMNVNYYSGFRSPMPYQMYQGCVFSRQGQISIIIPQIMHEFCRSSTWIEDEWVRPYGGGPYWGLPADPVELMVKTIKDLWLADKRIGVETGPPAAIMLTSYEEFDRLRQSLPQARFMNAVDHIWEQRMVKTGWEQNLMRKLAGITVKGYKTAIEKAYEGITETELLKSCWRVFVEEGICDAPIGGVVCFRGGGKDYSISIPRPENIPIAKGRQLFFDGGPTLKGYYADLQRQFCVGEPSPLQTRLFELAELGQQAAETAIKPGNRIRDIHAAAMEVIREVPQDLKSQGVENLYSHTFMGHSIGLNVHEPPMITAENETIIVPGMILCVEIPALDMPQFRVLGGFPEDIYLVTGDGFENLTHSLERKQYIIN